MGRVNFIILLIFETKIHITMRGRTKAVDGQPFNFNQTNVTHLQNKSNGLTLMKPK